MEHLDAVHLAVAALLVAAGLGPADRPVVNVTVTGRAGVSVSIDSLAMILRDLKKPVRCRAAAVNSTRMTVDCDWPTVMGVAQSLQDLASNTVMRMTKAIEQTAGPGARFDRVLIVTAPPGNPVDERALGVASLEQFQEFFDSYLLDVSATLQPLTETERGLRVDAKLRLRRSVDGQFSPVR